jgi:peptidoglycan/xylan/chitin deacetylase (PgdA/CDA1 family)
LPAPTDTPLPVSPAPSEIIGYSSYTITPGETLQDIAQRANSETDLILSYNHRTTLPQAGQSLIIPHLEYWPEAWISEPTLVLQGNPMNPWVALTLDAGAGSAPVPSILATLRERDVQITFFLTGNWIQENPDLARQIVADGHEIANHSLSHPDFTTLSDAQIIEELAVTEALMQETTGVSTRPFFRPPYGAYNERVLLTVANEGYLPIYWTLDSLDSIGEPKTPEFLVERVTGTLTPEELAGSILLAHCGSEETAQALPAILDRFAAMGLEVRMLSDVLEA